MRMIVELALKGLVSWIQNNPDAAFSRFMLTEHGPRQDVTAMTRLERLKSALCFLFLGILSFAILAAVCFLPYAFDGIAEDNLVVVTAMYFLVFSTGIGLIGGLYLLVRVIR